MSEYLKIAVSLIPVFVFLIGLIVMDSYKLLKSRSILMTLSIGCVVAIMSAFLNGWISRELKLEFIYYSRYSAPVLEETLKALFLFYLIRFEKVGFMVDAAIYGFAIGAGFAFVENIFYLNTIQDANIFVWIIRGFGTAVMHSTATAIFGMISKSLSDTFESQNLVLFLPGIFAAVFIHSFYNHFLLPPLLITICFVIGLILLTMVVFERSEQATRKWLGVGFDTDVDLLEMIVTGDILQTRVGRYLQSLKSRFPGEVVADMLCYLRIHLELAVRAKGILLLRQSGFQSKPDPEIKAKFVELQYLQNSIGKTGKLALLPFLRTSSRDLWQLYLIEK